MHTKKFFRNVISNVCVASLLIILVGGCNGKNENDLMNQNYKNLSQPLSLGQLKKVYGVIKHGHGPYVWYELPNRRQELWAWFMPIENRQPDEFQIMFLTEVEIDNPENVRVVWPEQYVGQSLEQVYKFTYQSIRKTNE